MKSMLILIPCKSLDQGKSRLSTCLDPRSRRALCEFFLCRTLALATSIVPARQVKVITSDPDAIRIAAEYGASSLPDRGVDLNSALAGARLSLMTGSVEASDALVLPIDLPYATPASLDLVMAAHADVTIAPDTEGAGTNVLYLSSQVFQKFPFAFGENSFQEHCATARHAGFVLQIIEDHRLAFDVDVPKQYERWIEDPSALAHHPCSDTATDHGLRSLK